MIRNKPQSLPEPVRPVLSGPDLGGSSFGADVEITGGDIIRRAELNKMKFWATALLVIAFIIFVIATILEARYVWVGFVRATAEAAMVGALADWFAVTALFRHPLGLKIPHTAIIPHRKDRIAQSFGLFVKSNFLAPDVICDKLKSIDVARQGALWLRQPENSEAIASYVMVGIAAVAEVMKDEDIQQLIEQGVAERARKIQLAPMLGSLLSVAISGTRQTELLHGILKLTSRLLQENEDLIKERIRREIPLRLLRSLDQPIYRKVVDAVEQTLEEVRANPDHPLQQQFTALVQSFDEDLKSSPEVMARVEELKEDLLRHEAVREFSSKLWTDFKASLLETGAQSEGNVRLPIRQGLVRFAEAILQDEAMQQKVNRWVEEAALYLAREYGYEVEQLIAQTIRRWDAEATSRKVELQIGKDLQYIRINGTIVGGLAGLLIHTFSFFFL